jgi:hypothetical protein
MANSVFAFTELTGGTAGALDDLIHTNITDGDIAIVGKKATEKKYFFIYDASSSAAENLTIDQMVVKPDSNSGNGRWIQVTRGDSLWYLTSKKIEAINTGVTVTGDMGATSISTTAANEWAFRQNSDQGTLTDGATINWDLSATNKQVVSVTLEGNRTMAAPTNLAAGATYILKIVQDATGNRTLTWNALFLWGPDGAPDLAYDANDVTVIAFYDDGTNLHGKRFYNES